MRLCEQGPPVRKLHDLAEIHDSDPMSQVFHRRQIVADEQQRQAQFVLQIRQQVDDLRLDRDIQGRDGLITDDQIGARRQGPGDADALALAAGEFVRKAVDRVARQTDFVHQRLNLFDQVAAAIDHAEIDQRFGQDIPDLHPRVQTAERVLEHHLHPLAHHSQLACLHVVDTLAVQINLAVGQLEKTQDRLADGGFAAAGFANQGQGFAAADIERYAIDGIDLGGDAAEQATVDGEMLLEVVDFEQGTFNSLDHAGTVCPA